MAKSNDYWTHLRTFPTKVLFGVGKNEDEVLAGKIAGRTCETVSSYKVVGNFRTGFSWKCTTWVSQRRRPVVEDELKRLSFFLLDSLEVDRVVIRVLTCTARRGSKGAGVRVSTARSPMEAADGLRVSTGRPLIIIIIKISGTE